MGVYIKGMEMPKDCIVCPFGWSGCNKQHDFVYMGSRADNCPLVPVPEHGRLIDADALIAAHKDVCSRSMKFNLDLAPTIIPASEEDGNECSD